MVFICCTYTECDFVACVNGPDGAETEHLIGPKSDWYPDHYPCPKCGANCASLLRLEAGKKPTLVLTPQEAFIAFSGGGLPEEQECSASRVSDLLTGAVLSKVSTRHIRGTNRCTLDCLELDNGTQLHLGSSVHGACVYRVSVRSNYVEKV